MPAPTSRLQAAAERFQDYLERLKKQRSGLYNQSMRRVEANVQKLLNTIGSGPLNEVRRTQIEKLIAAMSKANRLELDKRVNEHLDTLQSFASFSYEVEASMLARLTTAGSAISHAATSKKVWDYVRQRPLGATGDVLEPFVRDLSVRQVAVVEKTIRKAYANGWTVADTTRVLKGTRAKNYGDGLMVKLGRQTEVVVRTSMQHVNNAARQVVWEENNDIVIGYRWVSTLDDRTSDVCQDLDGEVFKINEGPLPPAHPNCRSTTVAELDSAFDALDKGATRSSVDGYVPADMTYGDWLASQEE